MRLDWKLLRDCFATRVNIFHLYLKYEGRSAPPVWMLYKLRAAEMVRKTLGVLQVLTRLIS